MPLFLIKKQIGCYPLNRNIYFLELKDVIEVEHRECRVGIGIGLESVTCTDQPSSTLRCWAERDLLCIKPRGACGGTSFPFLSHSLILMMTSVTLSTPFVLIYSMLTIKNKPHNFKRTFKV